MTVNLIRGERPRWKGRPENGVICIPPPRSLGHGIGNERTLCSYTYVVGKPNDSEESMNGGRIAEAGCTHTYLTANILINLAGLDLVPTQRTTHWL